MEAARVAVATATGEDGAAASDTTCETGGAGGGATAEAAAQDVARAVRVAGLLGLRLVGWCLSHDKVRRRIWREKQTAWDVKKSCRRKRDRG